MGYIIISVVCALVALGGLITFFVVNKPEPVAEEDILDEH